MKNPGVLLIGHPMLRRKALPLPRSALKRKNVQQHIRNMIAVMRRSQGVGLAANQVGLPWDIFVMENRSSRRYPGRPSFPLRIFVNADIVEHSQRIVHDFEGCLSIPGYRGRVPRARAVTLKAWDEQGRTIIHRFSGFEARVVQHECDHLQGFFYVDRMPDMKNWFAVPEPSKRGQRRGNR